uniref:RRM domain-containing protein n=1 Tax=Eutreptiella gymnastica TaxID=73025 RepID=A0A7S4LP40_9EUGL
MDLKRPNEDHLGIQAKRTRVEPDPSKVLYFRGLSPDTDEGDLTQFCSPFGRVAAVLRLKEKDQAFVEMESVVASTAILSFFSANQALIRNTPVIIAYSSRKQVTTNNSSSSTSNTPTSSVLHITINNLTHPVDCDVLHHIFSQYGGTVLKIVCYEKLGVRYALLEYTEPNAAMVAMTVLQGHSIYNDGCTLKINYSKLQHVTVRPDDANGRDFTAGLAAMGFPVPVVTAPAPPMVVAPAPAFKPMQPVTVSAPVVQAPRPAGPITAPLLPGSGKVLLVNNLNQERVTCDCLFKLFGTCGDVMRVKILFHKRNMALIEFRDSSHAAQAKTHLNNCALFNSNINIMVSKMNEVPMPPADSQESYEGLTQDYSSSPLHRFKLGASSRNANNITFPNQSLHINNIPDGATQEQLVAVFAMFGQLELFKFFSNTNKMGVARFATINDAVSVLVALHGESLDAYGFVGGQRGLTISFSKSQSQS